MKQPKKRVTKTNITRIEKGLLPESLLNEYAALIHEKGRFTNDFKPILSPIPNYEKDARIEIRVSTEFKSFLQLAALSEWKTVSELIIQQAFAAGLAMLLKKYPNIIDDLKKEGLEEYTIGDIVMTVGKLYYKPFFVKESGIFKDIVKKRKRVEAKKVILKKKSTSKKNKS